MEHECKSCGKFWLDHIFWRQCPHCGSDKLLWWDADREKDDDQLEIEDDLQT